MSEQSDEQLVKDYISGNARALEMLIFRYADSLHALAGHYVSTNKEAEDLTQEIFIKVWKNLRTFRTDKKFKSWILTVAKNTCIDFTRKRRLVNFADMATEQEEAILNSVADPGALPEDQLSRQEFIQEVGAALRQLPEIYRTVIVLYLEQDMNFQEISEALRTNVDTVKSRYRRGLLLLRKLLG